MVVKCQVDLKGSYASYVKGSPEIIKDICRKDSIPLDFD